MNTTTIENELFTYKGKDGETKYWNAYSSVKSNQNRLMADTGVFWYIAHEYNQGFYLETSEYQISLATLSNKVVA